LQVGDSGYCTHHIIVVLVVVSVFQLIATQKL